jgi:cobalt-precorrin-5B (C1)-methyltransferase
LTGEFPDPVSIQLPKGQRPAFALAQHALGNGYARAGIIKDAGDDPDVTHLAMVVAEVRQMPAGGGVSFVAGPGVGTVTLPGLPLDVGEPAINPAPRRMITQVVDEVAETHGASRDVRVQISVPGGEELAKRTWNPRLGILGGLSILGTTGVVIPYSCSAWIHSIHRGIDVARAAGFEHVAGCTGSTSERVVQELYALPDIAMLDMGDFAGGMLKYLRKNPIPKVIIGGGFAKLSKLAMGFMDLHSGRSQVDHAQLAQWVRELGADAQTCDAVRTANTANQILEIARQAELSIADYVADKAKQCAEKVARAGVDIEVIVIDRSGAVVGRSGTRES